MLRERPEGNLSKQQKINNDIFSKLAEINKDILVFSDDIRDKLRHVYTLFVDSQVKEEKNVD